MQENGTNVGHSVPMAHIEWTKHDESCQQRKGDADKDYSVEHDNEEGKLAMMTVII